jgi:5,5'-dehydrodivanillate O-demethylase oxygenase subunit
MMAITSAPPASSSSAQDWTDFFSVGPEALAGRYLRSFWQPIARSQDLQRGKARPVRMLGLEITLYRGESGTPHGVGFRCAHRGTQLSTGWVEGDELRCFYHGWKYDADGQCTEQPAEPEPFCSRIRIKRYPVREYLDLVFAYLGDGEPPDFPRFPQLEGDGVLETDYPSVIPCSYFNRIENSVDEVHIPFVHRNSFYSSQLTTLPEMSGEETEYGIARYGSRGDTQRLAHFLMPNILLRTGMPWDEGERWRDVIAWRVPIDDTHHTVFGVSLVHVTGEAADRYREQRREQRAKRPSTVEIGNKILAGDMPVEEAGYNQISIQDYVAQVGQGEILNHAADHLGRSDAVIVLLRSIWARELRALAEGRPLKQWRYPEHFALANGN